MSKVKSALIIPSQGQVVINQAKTVATVGKDTFNRDSSGTPYYVLKFRDKNNPFKTGVESVVIRANTLKAGANINWATATAQEKLDAQINYGAMDDATAFAEARKNGFVAPSLAHSITQNATVEMFVKYTHPTAEWVLNGVDKKGFSRIYPKGTEESVFMAEITRTDSGITIPAETAVEADVNDDQPF